MAEDGKKMSKTSDRTILILLHHEQIRVRRAAVITSSTLPWFVRRHFVSKRLASKRLYQRFCYPYGTVYQFFDQQVSLLKKVADLALHLMPQQERRTQMCSTVDMASCQSLLKFVMRRWLLTDCTLSCHDYSRYVGFILYTLSAKITIAHR